MKTFKQWGLIGALGLSCWMGLSAQPKTLKLEDALARITTAKQQLQTDRATLENAKPRMTIENYRSWQKKMREREELIASKEKVLREKMKQVQLDIKTREETGQNFYEQQAKFYRYISASDIDLSLD